MDELLDCYFSVYFSVIVEDPDQDIIRCRWAESARGECGQVCNAFLNATLDQVMSACIIYHNLDISIIVILTCTGKLCHLLQCNLPSWTVCSYHTN